MKIEIVDDDRMISMFDITPRTLSNWKCFGVPEYTHERISLELGTHPDWKNFKVLPGRIITPNNETVTLREIASFHWLRNSLRTELQINEGLRQKLRDKSALHEAVNNAEPASFENLAKLIR